MPAHPPSDASAERPSREQLESDAFNSIFIISSLSREDLSLRVTETAAAQYSVSGSDPTLPAYAPSLVSHLYPFSRNGIYLVFKCSFGSAKIGEKATSNVLHKDSAPVIDLERLCKDLVPSDDMDSESDIIFADVWSRSFAVAKLYFPFVYSPGRVTKSGLRRSVQRELEKHHFRLVAFDPVMHPDLKTIYMGEVKVTVQWLSHGPLPSYLPDLTVTDGEVKPYVIKQTVLKPLSDKSEGTPLAVCRALYLFDLLSVRRDPAISIAQRRLQARRNLSQLLRTSTSITKLNAELQALQKAKPNASGVALMPTYSAALQASDATPPKTSTRITGPDQPILARAPPKGKEKVRDAVAEQGPHRSRQPSPKSKGKILEEQEVQRPQVLANQSRDLQAISTKKAKGNISAPKPTSVPVSTRTPTSHASRSAATSSTRDIVSKVATAKNSLTEKVVSKALEPGIPSEALVETTSPSDQVLRSPGDEKNNASADSAVGEDVSDVSDCSSGKESRARQSCRQPSVKGKEKIRDEAGTAFLPKATSNSSRSAATKSNMEGLPSVPTATDSPANEAVSTLTSSSDSVVPSLSPSDKAPRPSVGDAIESITEALLLEDVSDVSGRSLMHDGTSSHEDGFRQVHYRRGKCRATSESSSSLVTKQIFHNTRAKSRLAQDSSMPADTAL